MKASKQIQKSSSITDTLLNSINNHLLDAIDGVCICVNQQYDITHVMGDLSNYSPYSNEALNNKLEKVLPLAFSKSIINGMEQLQSIPELSNIIKYIPFTKDKNSVSIKLCISANTIREQTDTTIFIVTLIATNTEIDDSNLANLEAIDQKEKETKILKQNLNNTREKLELAIQKSEKLKEELAEKHMALLKANSTIKNMKASVAEIEELNHFLSEVDSVSPAVIYIYDLESRSNVYASRSIGEILGYTKEEVAHYGSQLMPIIMIEEELPKIIAHHDNLKHVKDDNPLFIEYRMKDKSGSFRWVTSYDKPFKRNETGQTTQIIGVAQDITEQKELQLEQERLTKLFSNITNLSPGIIYIFDLEKEELMFSNAALGQLLGYSDIELHQLGSQLIDKFFHPEDIPMYVNHLARMRVVSDDEVYAIEYRLKNREGEFVWMSAQEKVYERDARGRTSKLIGMAQDESQQKQVQNQLEHANEELKRFAYISSHDLKEPLNTVISLIDVIKMEMEKTDPKLVDLLDLLDISTVRMKRLIDDLLSYSLLEQKQLTISNVDLEELLQHTQQDLSNAIAESKTTIELDTLPKIKGDATQLRQLFQNLLSNAIKYRTNTAPHIKIKVQDKARSWLFSIADNGIGISKKNLAKIFEVFQKLHATHEYEGTGIGLANCKRIVKNHKGEIWVASELGKGSTFYFTLAKDLK